MAFTTTSTSSVFRIILRHFPHVRLRRLRSSTTINQHARTSGRLTFDVDLGSESISEHRFVGIGRTSDHRHHLRRISTCVVIIVKTSQNAGFLIAHNTRGMKIGFTLAKSYLIYAPKLGESLSLCRFLALLFFFVDLSAMGGWSFERGPRSRSGRFRLQLGFLLVVGDSGYRGSVFNLVYKSTFPCFTYAITRDPVLHSLDLPPTYSSSADALLTYP